MGYVYHIYSIYSEAIKVFNHIAIMFFHKVLRKNVQLYTSKVQLLQALEPNDKPRQNEFAVNMLEQISEDTNFLTQVCFSDEATFLVSGKLNTHNVRIWGSEHPNVTKELQQDSPKVNVWCGIMVNQIIGPFLIIEISISADVYRDCLTIYVAPQLDDLQSTIIFQQDGAPPHLGLNVCEFLNGGLEGMAQFPGHLVPQISLTWTSFYVVMIKISRFKQRYGHQ